MTYASFLAYLFLKLKNKNTFWLYIVGFLYRGYFPNFNMHGGVLIYSTRARGSLKF